MLSFTAMEEGTLLGKISGFLVQNIPTAVLIFLMFLSKNRPKIGGTILIIIWAFFFFFFHAFQNLSIFFLIVPILISGLLFLFQDKLIQ
jgi:hypothetical protein